MSGSTHVGSSKSTEAERAAAGGGVRSTASAGKMGQSWDDLVGYFF